MRSNYGRSLLVGSAVFGVQALFGIYNTYLPIFLQSGRADFAAAGAVPGGFGLSTTLTGAIMTLDNLAALLILPYIGARSDATVSRLGKRKPYILLGAPVAALAFAVIPLSLGQPLWVFLLGVVITILAVDLIRTPILALMLDITPPRLRSQANGVLNLMGGLGVFVALLVGGALYRSSTSAPFFFGAGALLAGSLLVVSLLPVPPAAGGRATRRAWYQLPIAVGTRQEHPLSDLSRVWQESGRPLVYVAGAIFCAYLAFSALTVFVSSFAVVTLGVARGQEAQLLSITPLAIIAFALPAGLIGGRIGRKRAMQLGLLIFIAGTTPMGMLTALPLICVLLIISGIGWALIIVNALPMLLDAAPPERREQSGTFAGLFFLATQAAEVTGPLLAGGFLDLTGRAYRLLFVYTLIVALAALGVLSRLPRSERRDAIVEPALPG